MQDMNSCIFNTDNVKVNNIEKSSIEQFVEAIDQANEENVIKMTNLYAFDFKNDKPIKTNDTSFEWQPREDDNWIGKRRRTEDIIITKFKIDSNSKIPICALVGPNYRSQEYNNETDTFDYVKSKKKGADYSSFFKKDLDLNKDEDKKFMKQVFENSKAKRNSANSKKIPDGYF